MRSLAAVAAGIALAAMPRGASAWWCDGHMLVAQVAYLNLTPVAQAKADQLIGVLAT